MYLINNRIGNEPLQKKEKKRISLDNMELIYHEKDRLDDLMM
jgi:hypothetical protein